MKSFHNKPELKDLLLEEIKHHQELDQIVQGRYGDEDRPEKGFCAVGCAVHSLNVKLGKSYSTSDHSVYETELGIPRVLAKLEDRIFEGLSKEESKTFPFDFINAIPVGADLSTVWPKLALWLLVDKVDGVIKYAKTDKTRDAIQAVGDLYERVVKGEIVAITDWQVARKNAAAAADAAAAAAYAAAAAAYADAAAAYADAAAAAAAAAYAAAAYADAYADAADAAAAAAAYADADAAYADARRAHYTKMAAKLIELVKEAE